MRQLLAAVATAAALLAPAKAAGNELIARITPERMAAILEEMTGKKAELDKNDAGDPVVAIDPGNGYDEYILSRCDPQGCLDIQATAFFKKDPKFTLAAVNAYNSSYLNAQASLATDGRVFLFRFFVTDGGVSEENIKANIKIFMQAPDAFLDVLSKQATASIAPNGVPVSATVPSLAQVLSPALPHQIRRAGTDPNRAHKLK